MKNYEKWWNDPVWSKVIANGIVAILGAIILFLIAWVNNFDYQTFFTSLSKFLNSSIELTYFSLFIIGFLNILVLYIIKSIVLRYVRIKIHNTKKKVSDLAVATRSNNVRFCEVDENVKQLKISDFSPSDNSNLYYCLVNVYDGKEAENIFSNIICKRYKIQLEGAYEIMGKWDLLLKFRYSGTTQIKKIIQLYEKELDKKQVIYGDPTFNSVDISNRIMEYDVTKEMNPFKNKIEQKFLYTTENYLKTRSQRGFMFIEVHRDQRIDFMNKFTEHLGKYDQIKDIIEFFSICRNDIIINFFMRCSQTSQLILLNNAVEEFLQENELDVIKHTFLCFTFNEPIPALSN